MADALCKEYPDVDWFGHDVYPALAVCGRCTVRVDCLAFAQAEQLDHGVFGGQTARTRINARRLAAKRATS